MHAHARLNGIGYCLRQQQQRQQQSFTVATTGGGWSIPHVQISCVYDRTYLYSTSIASHKIWNYFFSSDCFGIFSSKPKMANNKDPWQKLPGLASRNRKYSKQNTGLTNNRSMMSYWRQKYCFGCSMFFRCCCCGFSVRSRQLEKNEKAKALAMTVYSCREEWNGARKRMKEIIHCPTLLIIRIDKCGLQMTFHNAFAICMRCNNRSFEVSNISYSVVLAFVDICL